MSSDKVEVTMESDCKQKMKNFFHFLLTVCPEDEHLSKLVETCDTKLLPGWYVFIERVHNWLEPIAVPFRNLLSSVEDPVEFKTNATFLIQHALQFHQLAFIEIGALVIKILQQATEVQFLTLARYLFYFEDAYNELSNDTVE